MAKQEFKIAGLEDGLVPQGLCFIEEENIWLISGYMADGSKDSRIYVVDAENAENNKFFNITGAENQFAKGHFGGVSYAGENVFVASEGHLLTLNLREVLSVENGGAVEIKNVFNTKTGADFLFCDGDFLWVGDFYRSGVENTPTSHHIEISKTEKNYAIALKFEINQNEDSGINQTPVLALSIPNQVQGFAQIQDGKIILTTSYSLPDSIIYVFDNPIELENKKTITLDFGEIPLKVLCAKNLIQNFEAPTMAEAIDITGEKVYILYESACDKYKMVTRTRNNFVESLKIEDLIKQN